MATFRDFITECIMFEHSAEHFDLVKECSELDLTCTFIADQKFMMENAPIITSGAVAFTEGYLHEAYDESTLEVLVEKAVSKSFNIKQKIYNACKKIFNGFMSFLRKFTIRFDKSNNDSQWCKNKLASLTITDEDIQAIQKIVNDAKSKENAFPIKANQPYLSNIKFGGYTSSSESITILRNDLAVALSNTTVVADCAKKGPVILSTEEIIDIAASIGMNYKNLNFAKVKGIATVIAKSIEKNYVNGLTIKADAKYIKKEADALQKIVDKIHETGRELSDAANNMIDQGKEVVKTVIKNGFAGEVNPDEVNADTDDIAEKMKELTKIYTKLSEAIGINMQIYTSLNTYRSDVVSQLKTYLESKSSGSDNNTK